MCLILCRKPTINLSAHPPMRMRLQYGPQESGWRQCSRRSEVSCLLTARSKCGHMMRLPERLSISLCAKLTLEIFCCLVIYCFASFAGGSEDVCWPFLASWMERTPQLIMHAFNGIKIPEQIVAENSNARYHLHGDSIGHVALLWTKKLWTLSGESVNYKTFICVLRM